LENSLLSLLCQPHEIQGTINIQKEIEFWGIDSGVRHSVAGADYSSVRIGTFIGYRIIARKVGLSTEKINKEIVKVRDDRWGGYLANVSPDEYECEFASIVPKTISGEGFLREYGGTTDPVTKIDHSITYAVKAPTEHAIYESFRVKKFAALLSEPVTEQNLENLGSLMFDSHESYSACELTEPRTNRIVELVRQNRSNGLYGARITGGGSGGTVAVLGGQNSRPAIEDILQKLETENGQKPYLFHGSSPGASRFGHIRLEPIKASVPKSS
jgi:L-arabinokinase